MKFQFEKFHIILFFSIWSIQQEISQYILSDISSYQKCQSKVNLSKRKKEKKMFDWIEFVTFSFHYLKVEIKFLSELKRLAIL